MARIRTIKPEFFTSSDIVSLSPIARLCFIAIWCEADRDGRLVWKPGTLKLRYFPGDDLDFHRVTTEIIDAGLVVLYDQDRLAYVPTFSKHQRPNPRESASTLPSPSGFSLVSTRDNLDLQRETVDNQGVNPDCCAQGGREGEGREGKEKSLRADASAQPAQAPTREATQTDTSTAEGQRLFFQEKLKAKANSPTPPAPSTIYDRANAEFEASRLLAAETAQRDHDKVSARFAALTGNGLDKAEVGSAESGLPKHPPTSPTDPFS